MGLLSKILNFGAKESSAEFTKAEFLEWVTAIAAARQAEPLDKAGLVLYYDRLKCFTKEEMLEAVGMLIDEPYRNFPTLGSFIEVIAAGSRMKPAVFAAQRRRRWAIGGTQVERTGKAEKQALLPRVEREPLPWVGADELLAKMEVGRLRHEINATEPVIDDPAAIKERGERKQELAKQAAGLKP